MEDNLQTSAVPTDDSKEKFLKHPDENALNIINSMTGETYTAEDIWTCRLRTVEDGPDRLFDEPTEQFINEFAEIAIGTRATLDHDLADVTKAWGIVYATEVKTDENRSVYCICDVFFPAKANSEEFIERIRSGIYHNVSPSYRATRRCSICGEVYDTGNCCSKNHIPGMEYDGKICKRQLISCLEIIEVSIVPLGCQHHASIITKSLTTTDGGKKMNVPSKRALKRNRFLDFIKKSFTEEDATELERQFDDVLAASDEEEATDDIMAENESLRSANAELEAKVADLEAQIAELNEKLKAEEDDAAAKAAEEDAKEEEQAIDQAIDDAVVESCGADEVIKKHFVGLVDRSKLSYNKETKEVIGLAEQIDIISKSFTDLSAALAAQKNTTVGLPKASGAKATSTTPKTVKNTDTWK